MKRLAGNAVEERLQLNHQLDGECWRWTRTHNSQGYGYLRVDRRHKSVHRLAYETWVGPIPEGLEIDHLCRVRDCINPAHLEAVTHAENRKRASAVQTHCAQGHEFSGSNLRWIKPSARPSPRRRCMTCFNANRRRRRAALKAQAGDKQRSIQAVSS